MHIMVPIVTFVISPNSVVCVAVQLRYVFSVCQTDTIWMEYHAWPANLPAKLVYHLLNAKAVSTTDIS